MKTYYVTFRMIDHVYTATWHQRDQQENWMKIENWIIQNIDRIDSVSKVEGGTDEDNQTNFNAIQITIQHYKEESNTTYEDELMPDNSHYDGDWQPYRSNNR